MEKPICVDLDGTLIKDDVTIYALRKFFKSNFFAIFKIILWLIKGGRAYLKKELAKRIKLEMNCLEYNKDFLDFLISKRKSGTPIFLATACDEVYANQIADELGIFDGVFASNGVINLRAEAKAQTLCIMFGEKGFIYAGNSEDDIAVWKKSAECILVSPSKAALKGMKNQKYLLF